MFTVTAQFADGDARSKAFGEDKDAAETFAEQVWAYPEVTYVAVERDGQIHSELEK